jgi:hypothetical protein
MSLSEVWLSCGMNDFDSLKTFPGFDYDFSFLHGMVLKDEEKRQETRDEL